MTYLINSLPQFFSGSLKQDSIAGNRSIIQRRTTPLNTDKNIYN